MPVSECEIEFTSPIRVLMVTPFPECSGHIVGGVAGVAYYLCQDLAAMQCIELDVLVPGCAIEKVITKQLSGLKVTYLPSAKQGVIERVLLRKDALKVQQIAATEGYDLVHIQAAPEWGKCLTLPVVVTLHGILEQDMLFRNNFLWLRKLLWPLVRVREQLKRSAIKNLIVINPYVSARLGGVFRGRSWNIENPVKNQYFSTQAVPVKNELLFVGVVSSRKNVDRLIQALAIVRKSVPSIRLRIAGSLADVEYYKRCRSRVQQLGLEDSVEFIGSVSILEMQARLKVAHLMVLCSLQETAPLSIAESMAVGVPVVASNICGIPNMVEEGVTGCLVDPKNVDDIARGIIAGLALDLEKAARRSRQLAQQRFAGDMVAKSTVEVYRELLSA